MTETGPVTLPELDVYFSVQDRVLSRFRIYYGEIVREDGRWPQAYDFDSFELDPLVPGDIIFYGEDHEGDTVTQRMPLALLVLTDEEFARQIGALREQVAQERERLRREAKIAEAERQRLLRERQDERKRLERDRIFREEAAARGIIVPDADSDLKQGASR